jgi:Zn-dependent protease
VQCDFCDVVEAIPFKCRYCKGSFCSSHRLPTSHRCAFLSEYLAQPARSREYLERIQGKAGSPPERLKTMVKDVVLLRFSKVEVLHLAIATALVTAVGLSLFNYVLRPEFLLIFATAFLLHELGHKFLAQFYRAWAEFRVLLFGAAITAFAALPFSPVKFIAPGVVWVSGNLSISRNGKVSWIGPLTNIVMSAGFLLAFYLISGHSNFRVEQLLVLGAKFNSFIALFNMIPFMGLDGEKIFGWKKKIWILTVAAAGLLYIATDLASGGAVFGFLRRYL